MPLWQSHLTQDQFQTLIGVCHPVPFCAPLKGYWLVQKEMYGPLPEGIPILPSSVWNSMELTPTAWKRGFSMAPNYP